MKIRGWEIDNFGVLNDYKIEDLPNGITVFFGPNEAGKSTLLGFLRAMLFGFTGLRGKRKSKNLFPALQSGKYGGKLFLENENGVYVVDREVNSKKTWITQPDGATGDQSHIQELMGHADWPVYESVFAFGLEELALLRTIGSQKVKDQIYSASFSSSQEEVQDVLDLLIREGNNVFGDKTLENVIFEASENYQRLRIRLLEAEKLHKAYPELVERVDQLRQGQEEIANTIVQQSSVSKRAQDLIQLWPLYGQMNSLKERLEGLDKVDSFIKDPEAKLRSAMAGVNGAKCQAERIQSKIETLKKLQEKESSETDPKIGTIEEQVLLEMDLESYQEMRRQLIQAQEEQSKLLTKLDHIFKSLGSHWDEEKVKRCDCSLEKRDEAQTWIERLETIEKEHVQTRNKYTEAKRARVVAQRDRDWLKGQLDTKAYDLDAVENRQRRIDQLRTSLIESNELRGKKEEVKNYLEDIDRGKRIKTLQVKPAKFIPVWTGPAFLVAVAAFLAASIFRYIDADRVGGVLLMITSVAIACAGVISYVNWRRPGMDVLGDLESLDLLHNSVSEKLRGVELQLNASEESVKRLGEETGLGQTPSCADIEIAASDLRRWRDEGVLIRARKTRLANGAPGLQMAELEEKELEAGLMGAQRSITLLKEQFDGWKRSVGLPVETSEKSVIELMEKLGVVKSMLMNWDEAAHAINRLKNQIIPWEEKAHRILSEAGREGDEDLESQIRTLLEERRNLTKNHQKRRSLNRSLNKLQEVLKILELEQEECQQQLDKLISRVDAKSPEDFLRRYEVFKERRGLRQTIEELETRIANMIGAGEHADNLVEEASKGEVEKWKEEQKEAELEIQRQRENQQNFKLELEEKERQISMIEESDEVSSLQADLNWNKTRIDRLVHDWRLMRFSRGLIENAMNSFVRKGQPEVIKNCSKIFKDVTNNYYSSVKMDEITGDLLVQNKKGQWKNSDQLSCGAAEQLYLSMRLGMVKNFNRTKAALPMIMDDVLVNFDPKRSERLAKALLEISKSNQIIFITCHPQTVEMLNKIAPNLRVEEMERQPELL